MLIKQAKDKGLNLGAAIEAARRFREKPRDDQQRLARAPERRRRVLGRDACSRRSRRRARPRRARSAAARARGGRAWSHAFHGTGPSTARSRATTRGAGGARPRARTARRRCSSSYGSRPAGCTAARIAAALGDHEARRASSGSRPVSRARPPAARPRARRAANASAAGSSRPPRPSLMQRVHVAAGVARPSRVHASATRGDLVVVELGERAHVPRRVHDDLLPLERGVEVRDDADRPARRVPTRYVSGGVRSSRPAQNGHSSSSASVGVLDQPPRRAGPAAAVRGDDDEPPGERVSPTLPARSRNGLIRSIGAGKMIVDVLRRRRARAASGGSGAGARSGAPRSRSPRPSAARPPGTRPRR